MTRQILWLLPDAVKWPSMDFSLLASLLPCRCWFSLVLMCVVLPSHATGFWKHCCMVFSVWRTDHLDLQRRQGYLQKLPVFLAHE